MILTTCLTIALIAIIFLAYLMDMYLGYEIVYIAMFVVPIYAYAKSKHKVINSFLILQILSVVARYVVSTVLAVNFESIPKPINIYTPMILQFAGLVNIVTWLIWFIVVFLIVYSTNMETISKAKSIDSLNKSKTIIRYTNLFMTTLIPLVTSMMVSIKAYSLMQYISNIIIFIVSAIIATICFSLFQTDAIRKKKEHFIELEKKLSDAEQEVSKVLE